METTVTTVKYQRTKRGEKSNFPVADQNPTYSKQHTNIVRNILIKNIADPSPRIAENEGATANSAKHDSIKSRSGKNFFLDPQ